MVLELNSCMTGPVRKNISYPLNTELELRIYGIEDFEQDFHIFH